MATHSARAERSSLQASHVIRPKGTNMGDLRLATGLWPRLLRAGGSFSLLAGGGCVLLTATLLKSDVLFLPMGSVLGSVGFVGTLAPASVVETSYTVGWGRFSRRVELERVVEVRATDKFPSFAGRTVSGIRYRTEDGAERFLPGSGALAPRRIDEWLDQLRLRCDGTQP